MTENKKEANNSIWGASGNAPLKESLNAPTQQFNGSRDAPNTNTRGKQVSSKITAND